MKQALCSLCALVVLTLVFGALTSALAQTPSATPDPFVIQLTSSPTGFRSGSSDISANGRFVVFESNGDVATEKIATRNPDGTINPNARNNEDGNREIFIADYAQRRIFQLTNTKSVPNATPTPSPTPSPSPTASPTPSPVPTPPNPLNINIEISNNRPMISLAPPLNGSFRRVYYIVFSSNAPNPANFDGVDTNGTLAADGNQELWTYRLPDIADVDLTSGVDFFQNLQIDANFTQLTNTPASRVPSPGGPNGAPFVADDNREATISDDGSIIAFISTRDLVSAVGNADGNPELFFYNRTTSTFVQATNTQSTFVGSTLFSVFQQNPSLSADGSVVAFLSNANLAGNNNDDGAGHGNGEIYRTTFNGSTVGTITQVTKTKVDTTQASVNLLSPGRRLSRNGALIAFESLAADPKANSATNEAFHAMFVYTIAGDTFNLVGSRALQSPGDIIHFPTFTDYDSALNPSTLIFTSALNFKTDGTFPTVEQDATGLNPERNAQIFSTQLPVTSTNTFRRLTKNPVGASFGGTRPLASDSVRRVVFSLGGTELGGGNTDNSTEVFYLLTPPVASESTVELSFFTGASEMPVPTVSPSPSPSPTPTPSPSPGTAAGVAAGELVIVRNSAEDFAPSNQTASGGSEGSRRPFLPVELNGVSVSVNGAAAVLHFVGNSPRQINFVVPIGLAPGTATVVINNNGRVFRSFIRIVAAQPDIFTLPGNRASVVNVTNPNARMGEPFAVMSLNDQNQLVPTELEVTLTGVRNVTPSEVTVTVGTTAITGSAIRVVRPLDLPGFDIITFVLPASLAGAGDVPIVVSVLRSGVTFTSRPADTAPHITISP